MLAHFELSYVSDRICRNTIKDSERALATILYNTLDLLCVSQTTDDLQQLNRLLSLTLAHPVVRNVLANNPAIVWERESGIAIAYLAWIAQLFQQDWDNSFQHRAHALAKLPGADQSLLQLREQLQQWQRTSPLQVVSAEWEPHQHFLLDLVAVFAIWSMTVIGGVELTLYAKVINLLQYENPFIVVYMACACLTHQNLPCTFGTIDAAAWDRYDRCHSLLQRFAENVRDSD